jgi:hypothetical protein
VSAQRMALCCGAPGRAAQPRCTVSTNAFSAASSSARLALPCLRHLVCCAGASTSRPEPPTPGGSAFMAARMLRISAAAERLLCCVRGRLARELSRALRVAPVWMVLVLARFLVRPT